MPPIVYVVTKLLLANHLIGLEKTSQSNMMILPRGMDFFLLLSNTNRIYLLIGLYILDNFVCSAHMSFRIKKCSGEVRSCRSLCEGLRLF